MPKTHSQSISKNNTPPGSGIRVIPAWQQILKAAVRDLAELLSLLDLSPEAIAQAHGLCDIEAIMRRFPLVVPRGFISRMKKGDPFDPLLRQILPVALEIDEVEGFSSDPVGERHATMVPGVLHKYAGRVLFVVTGVCGVHCRYCFRREFPYATAVVSAATIEAAVRYVASDGTIEEVILSGGDPLVLVDERIQELVIRLAHIPHVERLRVHTRLPIVVPERVTPELIAILTSSRLLPIVVVHANHGNEINQDVRQAMRTFRDAGIPVLNQAVLLRGVNDDVEVLKTLSLRLFDGGVLPYYLHLLDRVRGSAHFEVTEIQARALVSDLMRYLPGYLVPRLVREVPGLPFKRPVDLNIGDVENQPPEMR